jgi:hypothetical protein
MQVERGLLSLLGKSVELWTVDAWIGRMVLWRARGGGGRRSGDYGMTGGGARRRRRSRVSIWAWELLNPSCPSTAWPASGDWSSGALVETPPVRALG